MHETISQILTYMQQGGFVMYPLLIAAMFLWYAIGYRFLMLQRGSSLPIHTLFQHAIQQQRPPHSGIFKIVFQHALHIAHSTHPSQFRSQLETTLHPLFAQLNRFSLLIKVIVVLSPLAGLLGTVSGMIETFDALKHMTLHSQSGGGIAGGISQALISTQMGLAVAIPGLLIGRLLQRKQDHLENDLQLIIELFSHHYTNNHPTERNDHMRTSRPRKKSNSHEIDISPLIDMVFILLIFFMVSTTFVKDLKIDIQRPAAQSASNASTKSTRIHLDRTGNIFVDGSPVKSWMLQSRVRIILKQRSSSSILVITDRFVQAEKLIEVIDQCRLAGANDVGVATNKET